MDFGQLRCLSVGSLVVINVDGDAGNGGDYTCFGAGDMWGIPVPPSFFLLTYR